MRPRVQRLGLPFGDAQEECDRGCGELNREFRGQAVGARAQLLRVYRDVIGGGGLDQDVAEAVADFCAIIAGVVGFRRLTLGDLGSSPASTSQKFLDLVSPASPEQPVCPVGEFVSFARAISDTA